MFNQQLNEEMGNRRKKEGEKLKLLIYPQGFRPEAVETNGNIIKLKTKQNEKITFDSDSVYYHIVDMIDALYNAVKDDMEKINNNQKDDYNEVIVYSNTIILLCERAKTIYYIPNNEEYNKFKDALIGIEKDLKKCLKQESFLNYLQYLFNGDRAIFRETEHLFGITKLSDTDIINIIKNTIGKEDFKRKLYLYLDGIIDRPNVLKVLENEGFITPEDVKKVIEPFKLYNMYKETRKRHLLKYLKDEEYFMLYQEGIIDAKTLTKYTTIESLLYGYIQKEIQLEILGKKIYSKDASMINWRFFEEGYWTLDELRTIENFNYLNINVIIKEYLKQQQRKIKTELDENQSINEAKLLEFFTPEYVRNKINDKNLQEDTKLFFRNELKKIYSDNERSLNTELIKNVKIQNEDDEESRHRELIKLYELGLIDISDLKQGEISEEYLVNYYKNKGSNVELFIDFYNNGLVSGDTVLEEFGEDTDKVFEMIKSGLDASAIKGWFSTKELIKYWTSEKISRADLVKLKDDISLSDLEELYLSETIKFTDLYGFVQDGIITEEDADEINEKFDLCEAIAKLRARGIKGIKTGSFVNTCKGGNGATIVPSKVKKIAKKPGGLSPILKGELFESLGGSTDVIEFDEDHPFHGYVLFPIIDKKVGILEGDGRTCVVPLKLAIEGANNPYSANDILGNVKSRTDFYNNKGYVSSINHTKNWGKHLVEAVVERSSVLKPGDTKKIIQEVNKKSINGKPLLKALQQSYEERKKEINRN